MFRAFLAARSRCAEDQLASAFGHGVRQYVVLGAGLDTFAYRNPYPDLNIFEVDHPATQGWKRRQLQTAGIAVPESLRFVPVDFERQTLAAELEQGGLDLHAPAFFSWLGVTPYLTRESFVATASFVAKMPAGSGVAFDFAVDRELLNLGQRFALFVLSRRVAAAGEPFQLFFHPVELVKEMKDLGFHRAETLDTRRNQCSLFQRSCRRTARGRWIGPAYGCVGLSESFESRIPCKIDCDSLASCLRSRSAFVFSRQTQSSAARRR